ncbi:MAG: ABC transporter ATP-binding protein [Clostridia bacterium]|nr:ABC transporter ATP-binding protein [Clostridia bacterium]
MAKTIKNQKEKVVKPNLLQYLARYKFGVFLYVFTYVVACVCSIFITIFAANAIEAISGEIPDYLAGIKLGCVVLGLTALQRICYYLCGFFYTKFSTKIMSDLNLDLAKQAFKLNSKTFNDHDTGTFVQRIVSDPERIVDNLASCVEIVADIVTTAIMLVYIATLNPWIGLCLAGIVAIGMAVEFKRSKFRVKNRRELRKKNDKINSLTTEIVRSEKDIKSLGLEYKLSEVSNENYSSYRNARMRFENTDRNFYATRNFISELGAIAVCIFGIWLMDKGLLTLAMFMIIYSNKSSLSHFIWNIGNIANYVVDVKVSHDRMFSLFDQDEFVTETFGDVVKEDISGNIEFKDVSYTFREYEYDKNEGKKKRKDKNKKKEKKLVAENKIFNKLSFKVEQNTTVAFVGKSGSGKSTILNLMSKMYVVDEGEVLIDGININDLSKETLRKTISLVNQFPYIFDMTIKENLLLAKGDATDEEIWDAIAKASLKDFIDTLPRGIETRVGESGIKLSGGQKQRLAIARALLRNSNIIIFDESTSSLDNFAQEEVKKSIDGLKGKSTIVIVAHRLSTIKNVDKIFFLDGGKIVDSGSFEDLFERNEKFKAMFLAENI